MENENNTKDQQSVEKSVENESLDNSSSINLLISSDSRVGWPTQKPQYESLMHGWFFQSHVDVLKLLINSQTKYIVELGSWLGRSAQYFARTAPNSVIFAIDLWDDDIIRNDPHYHTNPENIAILSTGPIYDIFISNMWKYKPDFSLKTIAGVIPMKMDSCEGLRLLHSNQIVPDIIYIDASHHYDLVYRDISLAIQLFPNAHIVGDDWDYTDVRRAAMDVAKENGREIYEVGYKCWTYSKDMCIKENRKRGSQEEMEARERDKKKQAIQQRQNECKNSSVSKMMQIYKSIDRPK